MRKRLIILSLVLAICAVAGLIALPSRRNEPEYQGKPLSAWLVQLDSERVRDLFEKASGQIQSPATPQPGPAARAIEQMGEEAMPTLLEMIRSKDSKLKKALFDFSGRESFFRIELKSAVERRYRACWGFHALGSKAESAIPTLVQLLPDPDCGPAAAYSLAGIGTEGVRQLVKALKDQNGSVRQHSAFGLQSAHVDTELVVKALVECLEDRQAEVRVAAILSLRSLGTNAVTTARLALEKALQDRDPIVKRIAGMVLKQIAPRNLPQERSNDQSTQGP